MNITLCKKVSTSDDYFSFDEYGIVHQDHYVKKDSIGGDLSSFGPDLPAIGGDLPSIGADLLSITAYE